MKHIKIQAIILFLLFVFFGGVETASAAKSVREKSPANEKNVCFIVYDLNTNKKIMDSNKTRCTERIAVDSTFKIALSLIAFDQGIINQKTLFKWDGKDKGLPTWNQDQTPHTWLLNSAVWVSQAITPQLGMTTIKNYLKKFNYGNQDFSGDPGKKNGLTHAWLSSSLKMSGDEQFQFLKKLYYNELPVSQTAMTYTKDNMFIETTPNGWKLYGKTGSGYATIPQGMVLENTKALQDGWFVGYTEKGTQDYLFVMNFTDNTPSKTGKAGGTRAKEMTKKQLMQMGIL